MIIIQVEKNNAEVIQNETLTSGSLNTTAVYFRTSEEWDNLLKVACFRVEGNVPSPLAVDVYLKDMVEARAEEGEEKEIPEPDDPGVMPYMSPMCYIPYNMTMYPGTILMVGLYGVDPETKELILPTVWVELGEVQQGAYLSCSTPIAPPAIVLPGAGEGSSEGLSVQDVTKIIKKYMEANPPRYTEIVGRPEPISNAQLKELLK